MNITVEDDLIYIYLVDRSKVDSVSTIANVNGQLIHDHEENWLGFRVEKSHDIDKEPIKLPPLIRTDFITLNTEKYIDILFNKDVEPVKYFDQECYLDVSNGRIVGVEIIKYSWNPIGKLKWILPYVTVI